MNNIILLVFSILFASHGFSQQDSEILSEIEAIEKGLFETIQIKGNPIEKYTIQERMDLYKVPGVSIAVVKDGKLRWAKGYGYANTDTGTKVDANTLFQAGSISKPIAALAVLKLCENNTLELNRDVNDYLVDWKVPDNEFTQNEKVTLERLLTHTAGVTVHGFPGYQQKDDFPEIIDVLNGKGNTDKITVDILPGSIWRYSGGGYSIMEKVVEDVSGLSLDQYLSKNVLLPMGMNNSTYEQPISTKWQKNISAAYNRKGQLIKGLWNNYPEQAAAGLWTTPSDLAKYCLEIQEIAKGEKGGLLTKSTVEKMLTKHKNDWGLGPALRGEGTELIFGHGGKNAGFTNDMKARAYHGNAIIVMTNADNGSELITEIMNAISMQYGWTFSEPRMVELVELAPKDLEKFTGKYELVERGIKVKVQLNENQLILKNTPVGDISLDPMSEMKFIHLESGTVVEFLGDQKVTGLTVNDSIKLSKVEK